MRIFIAVDLPKEVRDYIFEIQNKLRILPAKIKWIAKKNLHLTLLFIGEVDENKLEQIKERLAKIKFKQFELQLDKLGVFPNENYIKVLWIDLTPKNEIIELQKKIDSEILDLLKLDAEFKVHLTLGRVKFVKNKEDFREKIKIKIESKKFKVTEFKIIKSDLTKDEPQYTDLETYKLI